MERYSANSELSQYSTVFRYHSCLSCLFLVLFTFAPEITMKFCANISFMFAEASSVLERYALAKAAGFKAIESGFPLGFTLEQVKEAKESAGIEQVLINLKTGK